MKSKIKNKLILIGLFALSVISFTSCSDDESYDFPGDSGTVYIRIQSSNLVNSVPNVISAKISKTPFGVSGEAVVKFPIRSTMPVKQALEVMIGVDNSLIGAYNELHETTYGSIDPALITISNNGKVIIESGLSVSTESVSVQINQEKQSQLELGEYLIPIKILRANGELNLSANWNTVFMIVSVVEDLSGLPLADRAGWTITASSEEKTGESGGKNGLAKYAIDGLTGTFWQSEWEASTAQPPHYVAINMGKEVKMIGFQYVARGHNTGWPKTIVVETSLNGTEWKSVNTYTDLPAGALKEFRTLFKEAKPTRYFRLTITEIHGGGPFSALAEVNAFTLN